MPHRVRCAEVLGSRSIAVWARALTAALPHFLIVLSCGALAIDAVDAAPRYIATPITLGGSQTYGAGINAAGDVTGWGYTPSAKNRGFVYSGGVVTDLGALEEADGQTRAYAINDSRQVTGSSSVATEIHAFLHSGGTMTDLGTLGEGLSEGFGINASGQVVGTSYIAVNNTIPRAFLYSGGTMIDLGTLGGSGSNAAAINIVGHVVGASDLTGTARHAFLYSGGTMTDLGTLGGTGSYATAINDTGQVVGSSQIAGDAASHAFIYSGGVIRDLGTLGSTDSFATGVNAQGWIVGNSGNNAPFLSIEGTMHDLNALVVSGLAGARLLTAAGINNRGQIVANSCGIPGGGQIPCSAYRLDPIAESATAAVPTLSTWMLIATSALLLVSMRLLQRKGRQV